LIINLLIGNLGATNYYNSAKKYLFQKKG